MGNVRDRRRLGRCTSGESLKRGRALSRGCQSIVSLHRACVLVTNYEVLLDIVCCCRL